MHTMERLYFSIYSMYTYLESDYMKILTNLLIYYCVNDVDRVYIDIYLKDYHKFRELPFLSLF